MSRRVSSGFVLAVAAILAFAGAVQAAPPQSVSLTLLRAGDDLSEIGWSATGAISDAGEWTTQGRQIGGSDHSKAFVVTQVLTTEVGANGTFHLRFQGRENAVISFSGNWQLYGGSGAYATLTGTGHWYATETSDGNLMFVLTGTVR